MKKLGVERERELEEYLDFSEFDKFIEILNKQLVGTYVNKSAIEYLMATFLFHTNIKGTIASKYGLNGVVVTKVDSETKDDFSKIQEAIDHIDKAKSLIKNLKSNPSDQFVTYAQFGINKPLNSHLEELLKAFKTAIRLSKGKADNKKTYYLALKQVSELYCPALSESSNKMSALQHWELFKLKAIYCVFLIKQKLVKKEYGTFNEEFWDIEKGLNNSLNIIEPEFISKIERY